MAGRAERALHGLGRPREDVAARSHGATDEDGLSDAPILVTDLWRSRAEGPRRPFAVHQDLLFDSIHHVLLNLRNVVGYIVNCAHSEFLLVPLKDCCEALPDSFCHQTSIDKREIRCCSHGSKVLLSLLGLDTTASQLPVYYRDPLLLHNLLCLGHGIRTDLMPKTSASTMQHDTNSAKFETHRGSCFFIVYFLHHLNLCVVIAGTK
mmetsp:Transcript_33565/g.105700  ORF Transcript_33565/g.105700 Transcript_33565/m.105700 type:complete len:207 (-) Transcript_33565:1136-1756(-)